MSDMTHVIVGGSDIDQPATDSTSRRLKGLVAACSGNLVEWYDFFVYAYTAIYFSASFFPPGDQTSQLLASAGIFAIGFFMRPLGGWLFGRLADRQGRKISMIIAVAMMSVGSMIIAVTPTYAQIGTAAAVILTLARLLQGLSVGAEYGTGATYISEAAVSGRRGFFSSFQYVTIIAGQLLALLIVSILQLTLTVAQLESWGWRIPFAIGAVAAVVVFFLRRRMTETSNAKDRHRKEAGSIKELLRHKKSTLLVCAFTAAGSLYFYTFSTYMQKFLVMSAKMDKATVSGVMATALVCFMIAQPFFGRLADRIGLRSNMLLFTGLAALLVVPILYTLSTATSPYAAFVLIVAGLMIAAFYTSISGVVKADLFPPTVRALGVGLPYAIANAMFGGTAEYVALWLRSVGMEDLFFYHVAAMAVIGFIASALLPNLKQHGHLDGDARAEENIGFSTALAGRTS